ncbi:MAG: YihY/virulence factor BrkB family protein [Candidatus Cryptobacteroides sp.]
MKDILKKIQRITDFLKNEIWTLDNEELSKAKARFVKYTKVVLITFKTFSAEKIGFQAAALSFFCTMSAVPIVAVAFAVTGGLGLGDKLKELLYMYFSNSQETIDLLLGFADNIITTAQTSTIGLISALLFLWVVIWMMMSVERVFNSVWQVRKSRNVFKRLSIYIAMLFIAPFIVMIFFSGSYVFDELLEYIGLNVAAFTAFKTLLKWILSGVVAILIFSAMYKFIPNVDVKYSEALRAASLSGAAFTIMQYLYVETQMFVTRLDAVYGAFALIPLFMVWLNVGWNIILIGSELSYAFQNVDSYNIDN